MEYTYEILDLNVLEAAYSAAAKKLNQTHGPEQALVLNEMIRITGELRLACQARVIIAMEGHYNGALEAFSERAKAYACRLTQLEASRIKSKAIREVQSGTFSGWTVGMEDC